MQRTSIRSTCWGGRRRAGRAHVAWVIPLLLVLLIAALLVLARRPPAERALLRGRGYLDAGRMDRAGAEFERAVQFDPRLVAAWRGLLDASPDPATCRRVADHLPALFDLDQPVSDPALLVRGSRWDGAAWERSYAVYKRALAAFRPGSSDPAAELIGLDFAGRREVAAAWAEARKIRTELEVDLREQFPPGSLRPLAVYDLAAARALLLRSADRFKELRRWMETCVRVDRAMKTCSDGAAKLEAVAVRAPGFAPAQLTLAYMDLARGNPAAAEKRCRILAAARAAEPATPADERIRYCLARALEVQGQFAAASAQVEQVLARDPAEPAVLLRLGVLLLREGRIDEANAIADRLLRGNEFDTRPSSLKGFACLRRGEYETAVAQLTVALEYGAYDPDVHYALALAREKAGQHLSASTEFMRVAGDGADPAWPLAAASASALAAGKPALAIEAADALLANAAALKAHPKLREYALRFKVAALALAGGKLDGLPAEDLYDAASERETAGYLIAGVWAGDACVSPDAPIPVDEKKLDFFRSRAVADPSAKYCLAFLLAARGDAPAARDLLKELVATRPDYVLAALELARLYTLEGKPELASRVLEQTSQADRPPEVARTLALLRALQRAALPAPSPPYGAAGASAGLLGPHLALFDMVVASDPTACTQLAVLLDPVGRYPLQVLALTYERVRPAGLQGIGLAARSDRQAGLMIQRGLALYQTRESGLYRLAIGRFWQEVPLYR